MIGWNLRPVAKAGADVAACTILSVGLQLVTFPALGFAWTPIHLLQTAGFFALASLVRGIIPRVRDARRRGRSA